MVPVAIPGCRTAYMLVIQAQAGRNESLSSRHPGESRDPVTLIGEKGAESLGPGFRVGLRPPRPRNDELCAFRRVPSPSPESQRKPLIPSSRRKPGRCRNENLSSRHPGESRDPVTLIGEKGAESLEFRVPRRTSSAAAPE